MAKRCQGGAAPDSRTSRPLSLNEQRTARAALDLLLEFRSQGMSACLISHKSTRSPRVADPAITVRRDGRTVDTGLPRRRVEEDRHPPQDGGSRDPRESRPQARAEHRRCRCQVENGRSIIRCMPTRPWSSRKVDSCAGAGELAGIAVDGRRAHRFAIACSAARGARKMHRPRHAAPGRSGRPLGPSAAPSSWPGLRHRRPQAARPCRRHVSERNIKTCQLGSVAAGGHRDIKEFSSGERYRKPLRIPC